MRQIDSLERQVQQISREIDQLRYAVQGQGQYRESTADYETGSRSQPLMGSRTSYEERWSDGYQGRSTRGSDRFEVDRSPGGQVGEDRTRPGNDRFDPND